MNLYTICVILELIKQINTYYYDETTIFPPLNSIIIGYGISI
jgi:hypothetical protein